MASSSIHCLSICSGVGGLELGLKLALPGSRVVGFIERDSYAAASLVARMADASLDQAPIWDDMQTFDGRPWRSKVDLISAGFPCQPYSVCGRRRGTEDERWIWPDLARIVREVEPQLVFLENVPGLLLGGIEHVLSDLAEIGFNAEWDVLSAAQCRASHFRERLFILAYADGKPRQWPRRRLADEQTEETHGGSQQLGAECGPETSSPVGAWPPGPGEIDAWLDVLRQRRELAPAVEPELHRLAHGMAGWVERLRTAGNGVVPVVAALAFITLARRAGIAAGYLT